MGRHDLSIVQPQPEQNSEEEEGEDEQSQREEGQEQGQEHDQDQEDPSEGPVSQEEGGELGNEDLGNDEGPEEDLRGSQEAAKSQDDEDQITDQKIDVESAPAQTKDVVGQEPATTSSSHSTSSASDKNKWIGGRPPGTFRWPPHGAGSRIYPRDFYRLLAKTDSVMVVGIFGKTHSGIDLGSNSSSSVSKEGVLDTVLQRDVFWLAAEEEENDDGAEKIFDVGKEPYIQGFVDRDSGKIYLNLRGLCDTSILTQQCELASKELEQNGYQSFLAARTFAGCRLLLFMLHSCHLLVMYQANYTIDLQLIQMLRALESVRFKLQPLLSDALKSDCKTSLGREWISRGRQTPPRMLFYFATCPVGLRGSRGTNDLVKRDGKVSRHPPIRKLEFSLEDQIKQIWTRARIAGLAHLPTREGFVYVENGLAVDDADRDMQLLYRQFENPAEPEELSSPFLPYFEEKNLEESRSGRCFARFLQGRLDTIPSRGTDGEGKTGGLQLPTLAQWLSYCQAVLPFFTGDGKVNKVELDRAFGPLRAYCDIDIRFSEYRCSKALPQAIAAYKDGLQAQYVEEYHNAKLLQAMSLFSMSARGPATAKYAEMLADECVDYWRGGRQLCEERSLTGRRCANRKHRVPGAAVAPVSEGTADGTGAKKVLPTMPHNSGVTFPVACNCGRKLFTREDPFTLADANFNFYLEVEQDCCRELDRLDFPVFASARGANTSATTLKGLTSAKSDESDEEEDEEEEEDQDKTDSDSDQDEQEEGGAADKKQKSGRRRRETRRTLADLATSKGLSRQASSAEPVDYMPTANTPAGKLPLFPSWSLMHLGSSYLYSHSSGVSQPGFFPGSKFLLPWDVPVKEPAWETIKAHWPNLADIAMKRPNFQPRGKMASIGLTVKVFLGFEYECPGGGHRFMAASPDKPMARTASASNPGTAALRDAASKVLNHDMPLYMACPCRQQQQQQHAHPARLARLHVVTPKAPLNVVLNPRVQPCPDGPVFHPAWVGSGPPVPRKLPHNSVLVLRLPYVYCGEKGAHIPPKEMPDDPLYGRLLKGTFSTTEDFEHISF